MANEPGWPVCSCCGDRVGSYEPAWVEHADGSISASSLLNLDGAARRAATRVWHSACFEGSGDPGPHRDRLAPRPGEPLRFDRGYRAPLS